MHDGYTKDQTALLFVDPYNDFLSDGSKLWPYVREVAEEVGLLDNLRAITAAKGRYPSFHRAFRRESRSDRRYG